MDRAALSPLLRSFERHLRAENRSEHTIASYLESLRQAEAFLAGRGRGLLDARREDLEAFLGDLLRRRAPETVATRYRRLRVLYRWLEEEDEITADPMAKMKPPIIPEQPVPVVPEDGLRRLLAACAGKDSQARRDTEIEVIQPTRRVDLPRSTLWLGRVASDSHAKPIMFMIHRDTPGLRIDADIWRPTGMRACVSPWIYLADCFVPDENLLGKPGQFLGENWMGKINFAFTANYLGSSRAIYDYMLEAPDA